MIPTSSKKSPRVRGFRAAALPVLLSMLLAAGTAAANFTVTNTADSGAGSLRQALADAAAAAGADTVDFAPGLSGQTITLTSGALTTADAEGVTVDATALAGLTLNGGGANRIFLVANGNIVTLRGLTLTGGSSNSGGGAIYANPASVLSLENCTLTGNADIDTGGTGGTGGGAIFCDAASVTLSHCTLTGNTCTVTSAALAGGGAIFGQVNSTLNLSDCTLSGNAVIGSGSSQTGGAIRASSTTVTVQRCTFSGNTSTTIGGAIGDSGFPGQNPLTCLDCTFVNNTAGTQGGAIRIGSQQPFLTNCTFFGNTCTDPASQGGAIYSLETSSVTPAVITHCTVVNNHAGQDSGGAFFRKLDVANSIFAYNTAATSPDLKGDVSNPIINAFGRNIITTDSVTFASGASTVFHTDPRLAPLGDYGGPTLTMPPLPASPALDAAVESTLATDQRGHARPVSFYLTGLPLADIGAVEVSLDGSDIRPTALTYSANPATYTRTLFVPYNTPANSGGGGLAYSVAPALPAGLTLNATSGVISGTPTVTAPPADYLLTATNAGGSTSATVNITVNDLPPSYTQAQYDANFTAGQTNVITNPNTFSLYTLSQVQTLNIGTPLLTKDAGTGQFKLTIGVKKSTNLNQPFTDFPLTAPGASINPQGKLEFLFTVPGNAAFFRLESQ